MNGQLKELPSVEESITSDFEVTAPSCLDDELTSCCSVCFSGFKPWQLGLLGTLGTMLPDLWGWSSVCLSPLQQPSPQEQREVLHRQAGHLPLLQRHPLPRQRWVPSCSCPPFTGSEHWLSALKPLSKGSLKPPQNAVIKARRSSLVPYSNSLPTPHPGCRGRRTLEWKNLL